MHVILNMAPNLRILNFNLQKHSAIHSHYMKDIGRFWNLGFRVNWMGTFSNPALLHFICRKHGSNKWFKFHIKKKSANIFFSQNQNNFLVHESGTSVELAGLCACLLVCLSIGNRAQYSGLRGQTAYMKTELKLITKVTWVIRAEHM